MSVAIESTPKGDSEVARSLVHTVRVVSGRNWDRFTSKLTAAHVALTEAMPAGTEAQVSELASKGDPEALGFLLRCQVLAASAGLVELCRMASALNEFATMDEALGAVEAAFSAPGLLEVDAVHAALLGVGELGPEVRAVTPEADNDQDPAAAEA